MEVSGSKSMVMGLADFYRKARYIFLHNVIHVNYSFLRHCYLIMHYWFICNDVHYSLRKPILHSLWGLLKGFVLITSKPWTYLDETWNITGVVGQSRLKLAFCAECKWSSCFAEPHKYQLKVHYCASLCCELLNMLCLYASHWHVCMQPCIP